MKRFLSVLLTVGLFPSFACAAAAATRTPPADEYVTEHGWGTLRLIKKADGAQGFTIETVGSNGHSCTLAGDVANNRATLAAAESDKPCVVNFTPEAGGYRVASGADGACRYYCGASAGFDAVYLKPPIGCRASEMRKTRDTFKRQYDLKDYPGARATLEPLFKNCGAFLHWLDTARIRNDLAVTLHKLNDLVGCRKLLEPLVEDAATSDAVLRETHTPLEGTAYLPIVKATRTNLRLCSEAENK